MHTLAAFRSLRSSMLSLCLAVALAGCDEAATVAGPTTAGLLTVSNVTSGGAFDVDGFTVRIDGGEAQVMELNDSLTVQSWTEGAHTVEMGGVAENCAVSDATTREVAVTKGETTRVDFVVTCAPPSELAAIRIVFARTWGNASTLVAMNADGSGEAALTSGGLVYGPDISPDGTRILFTRGPALWVMSTLGAGETHLADWGAQDASWSPDGSEIVFAGTDLDDRAALFVGRADGSAVTEITGQDPIVGDFSPVWSPDGTRIAFTRDESVLLASNPLEVWMIARDGSGGEPLTAGGGSAYPVWAADGRIAFVGFTDGAVDGIRVVNADGSSATSLLEVESGSVPSLRPHDWSSDGLLLLFTKDTGPGRTDVFLLSTEDGSIVRLTADGAKNITPTFW